jgi:competence protein ComEA
MIQNLDRKTLALVLLLLGGSSLVPSCVRLPRRAAITSEPVAVSSRQDRGVININTAPASELERLPGVGKALATRIVTHRENFGAFRRPEHLLMVRGISDRKFRELRPLITVE